jgi:tetratricopeptide (TPR) repeat protein
MSKQQRLLVVGTSTALFISGLFVPAFVHAQPVTTKPPDAPAAQAPAQHPSARTPLANPRQQAFLRFMEARRLRAEMQTRRSLDASLLDQTIAAYRDTLWLDPQAAEPRVDLGELYFFFKNDLRSAEREALEAIKNDSACVGAHLLLARLSIAVIKFENQTSQQVTNQLDRALREFETVTKLDGNSAEAWALLAELYRMKSNTAKQLQALERWASAPLPSEQNFYFWLTNANLTPDQAFAQLSQLYLSEGRHRDALDAARRAYEFDPENSEFGRNLIGILRSAATISEELKLYARLSVTAPSPALEIGYSSALIRAGRYDEAIEKLQEQAKGTAASNSLIGLLATAQRRAGQRAAAAETLKSALARSDTKSRTSLLLELAETYEELGRHDEALAQYDQILDALTAKGPVSEQSEGLFNHVAGKIARLCRHTGNQDKLQALLSRARRAIHEQNPLIETLNIESLREEGKRREALELTRAAIRRAPQDRSLRLTEVLLLSELKRYQESIELLRGMFTGQAERVAEDASIYLILSNVQMQAGELKEAEAAARKALELNPGDADALLQLSSVLDHAKTHTEAEQLLRDLLEREPDNATALNNLGYFWVERGVRLPEALTLIERAVAIEPLNGSFLDSLGWVLYKLNQPEKARAQLEKALLYSRRNPALHEHLGDVLLKLGKLAEARRLWEKALEYSLETDEVARLKDKLKDAR